MMNFIIFNGIQIYFKFIGGSEGKLYGPPELCYEAELPELIILSRDILNWDDFSSTYGANGEFPKIELTIEKMLDRVINDDFELIYDLATEEYEKHIQYLEDKYYGD